MTRRPLVERVRTVASIWRAGALAAASVVVSEIGTRIGLPGVDGERVAATLRAMGWGPIRWYDLLAGGATSRGAILALGLLPYLQARLYLWLGRALARRAWHRALPSPSRRVVLGVTTGLALVQSVGFARFLGTVSGAVVDPGAGFVLRTALLATGASLALGWLTEALVNPADDDDRGSVKPDLATPPRPDGVTSETGTQPLLTEGAAATMPRAHVAPDREEDVRRDRLPGGRRQAYRSRQG